MSSFCLTDSGTAVFPSNSRLLMIPDCTNEYSEFISLTSIKQPSSTEGIDKHEKVGSSSENSIRQPEPSQHTVCANFSPSGCHFALIDEQKQLHLWCTKENKWSLLSIRIISRRAVCLKFSNNEDVILVADRGGDVYSFSVTSPAQPGVLRLGHLSMLLDMVISPDDKYLITCDRDEKIRVSHYPNCYNICSYCLGHIKFVSSLSFIPSHPDVLISGSGDGTFKVWRYQQGLKLFERNYMADISGVKSDQAVSDECMHKTTSVSLSENERNSSPAVNQLQCSPIHNILAATFDSRSCLIIYHYRFVQQSSSFSILGTQLLMYNSEPRTILFDSQGWLLTFLAEDCYLKVLQPLCCDQSVEFVGEELDHKYLPLINTINKHQEFFSDSPMIETNFDILYKKWYDNFEEYQEKKQHKKNRKRFKGSCTQKE